MLSISWFLIINLSEIIVLFPLYDRIINIYNNVIQCYTIIGDNINTESCKFKAIENNNIICHCDVVDDGVIYSIDTKTDIM